MKYRWKLKSTNLFQKSLNFYSVENMYKWMEGLEKFEPISGTPVKLEAKSKLTFKTKRDH
ncbi:MAG: hypothetical protein IPO32_19720 [Crocinitomicaceae bacterium]|nr:hypothetical protein [Crocinitomicaceae bacterium]